MKLGQTIEVVGATTNNLHDVDVRLPENAVTAVIGVSGSGKSSLVDRTIAAVATERTRRFLDIPLPGAGEDVPAFVGATPPAIVVAQRAFQASTRNTVATSTALMRVLRRLFLRFSRPFATEADDDVPAATPEVVAEWLIRHAKGRAIVWAVPAYQVRTDGIREVRSLAQAGVAEVVVYSETDKGKKAETGTRHSTLKFKGLRPDVRHSLEAEVGEVVIGSKAGPRLLEFLRKAWSVNPDGVFVELPESTDPGLRRTFTYGFESRRHRVHPASKRVFRVPDAHLFSFNAPGHEDSGACPSCQGLGIATDVQEHLLAVRPELSMHDGAFALWTEKNYRYVNIQHETIEGLRGRNGFDPDLPWRRLPASARRLILSGSDEPVIDVDLKTKRKASAPHAFAGFRAAILDRIGRQSVAGESLKRFVSTGACPVCDGTRWCPETRALRVGRRSIDEVLETPFSKLAADAVEWRKIAQKEAASTPAAREVDLLIQNVAHIAHSFMNVGLGHLSGSRSLLDVSDGEARRIRLAGVLSSRLSGLLLVLDEPGRGLHEADLERLAKTIGDVARSHTVLMSEHRARLVRCAHQLIELGPGAGPDGGRIVSPSINGRKSAMVGDHDHKASNGRTRFLEFQGVSVNTVHNQNVRIPLGAFTCIAGVSGSGKSSFVRGAVVPALIEALPSGASQTEDFRVVHGTWTGCKGLEHVKALYALDQGSPSSQPRSLVATYLGFADGLRREFASTAAARALDLVAADFGTNAGRGRCQSCMGLGTSTDGGACTVCGGRRFGHDALTIRVGGLNIAEWLDVPLSALRNSPFPWISDGLVSSLIELGVGHLSLGRSLNTLSGGEVQRLRLSRAIAVEGCSGAVFVLDEPACGLHPHDVENLYRALRHVVGGGRNTVVAVEHDPYLLSQCDYLVEFGPGGGPQGGEVVAEGSPERVRAGSTATGWALNNPARPTVKKVSVPETDAVDPIDAGEAQAARQEIRQILGDDVVPPEESGTLRPGAVFDRNSVDVRPLELGGLDRALVRFAVDALPPVQSALARLFDVWARNPEATLHVNPLLDSISVWGTVVPASTIRQSRKDAVAMGLDDFEVDGPNALSLWVSGERLKASGSDGAGREAALRDAWALGSGFVELIDRSGKSIASATDRLINFEQGQVGPRRLRVDNFVRAHALGRCPMCMGQRLVQDPDEKRTIGNPKASVTDDDFLAPALASQLKGFRRSELLPFFRRMIEEGLWRDVAWNRMTPDERAVIMSGYWVRPGPGTFLKHGRDMDGSEVNHWLIWRGLAAEAGSKLARASDGKSNSPSVWAARSCPMCDGTGLSRNARLLPLAGKSWQDWVKGGMIHELLEAIGACDPVNTRHAMEQERILECLKTFKSTKVRLNEPVSTEVGQAALTVITKRFAGLTAFYV